MDGEIGRGDRVRRLEDREARPASRGARGTRGGRRSRDLRVLEHPGRLFELPGITFSWVTNSTESPTARIRSALFNRLCLLRRLDAVEAHVDQGRTARPSSRGSVREPLARVPSTRSPAIVSRSGNRNQNSFGRSGRPPSRGSSVPRRAGPRVPRSSSPRTSARSPPRRSRRRRTRFPKRPRTRRPPLADHIEEDPHGGEDDDTVQRERDDPLRPVDLEGPVLADDVEPVHHERIPGPHPGRR